MAWDVSADALVRGSSGLAFVAVAVALGVLDRRLGPKTRSLSRGLLVFLGGWGIALGVLNFGPRSDPVIDPWLESVGALFALVGFFGGLRALLAVLPARGALRWAALVLPGAWMVVSMAAIADLGAAYIAVTGAQAVAVSQYFWYVLASRTGYAVALAIGIALAARASEPSARALAVAIAIWPATLIGEFAIGLSRSPLGLASSILGALTVVSFALVWLPHARIVALAPLLTLDAGMVETTVYGVQTGFVGIVRIVAAALIAFAIFRHDLLDAGLRSATARRGTMATVGLASLFVVAQVALPFVSGGMGLVLGGVVAAGLTLAGPVIQRGLDRRAPPPSATAEKLATYRDAVQYALRDGVMSRKEETHLASLAQHLGIGAADALKVRHEVEDERAGVKRNP